MFREESRLRRMAIGEHLSDGELLFVFAGNDELSIEDAPTWERRDPNFVYLTGIDIPGALLMLGRLNGRMQEFLFVPRRSDTDAFYLGVSPNPDYYRARCGIGSIVYLDELDSLLNNFNLVSKLRKIYFASGLEKVSKYPSYEGLLADKLRHSMPGIEFGRLTEELSFLRLRKSPLEIAQIQKAVDIAGSAICETAKALKPGMQDYQLKSILEHSMRMQGSTPFSLVLLGKDATILHNFCPQNVAKDGDLLLIDCSAWVNYYASDISRVFPVSGKFTAEQAYWYNVCLTTQEMVIENLAPGKYWADCGKEANAYLESELRKHGYLGAQEDVRTLIGQCRKNFVTPGMVNHGIGLQLAEGRMSEDGRIVPGMVFTVEPGIYFGDMGIGIRIEDDVLITETGYKVLSGDIPKKIKDIEALMAQ